MPCRDYDDNGSSTIALYRQRNDELASMLCEACRTMQQYGVIPNGRIAVWWKKHQEADRAAEFMRRKQLEEDKKRKEAMKKLTPEERKLLGVK